MMTNNDNKRSDGCACYWQLPETFLQKKPSALDMPALEHEVLCDGGAPSPSSVCVPWSS